MAAHPEPTRPAPSTDVRASAVRIAALGRAIGTSLSAASARLRRASERAGQRPPRR